MMVNICCDTCPLAPSCEEINDFEAYIFGFNDDYDDYNGYPEDHYGE